jgi:long-chain acyl-CoA synthetase
MSILRALPAHLRRRTAVAAAADTFFTSRLLGTVVSLVLCAFPFSRTGRTRESLERCGSLADDGWSVLVFPEGTRSLTGRLGPFRGGIGVLALGLRAPVVPIAVKGTFELLPKGARRPGRGPVSVSFGPRVELPAGIGHEQATALIEGAVRSLAERAVRGSHSRSREAGDLAALRDGG